MDARKPTEVADAARPATAAGGKPPTPPPEPRFLYEVDATFNQLYDEASARTATPAAKTRPGRFYNTFQLFLTTLQLRGEMAECGCWRGLSSYIMNHGLRQRDPAYRGAGWHMIDSFEGLSAPTAEDAIPESIRADICRKFGSVAGAFAADLVEVQQAFTELPGIAWHRGWIPAVLATLAETRYRFVHIDLDLHAPTRAALDYFHPRMVEGGLIVVNDYGSLAWPGARDAVNAFATERRIEPLALSTGQAILVRRGTPAGFLERTLFRAANWTRCRRETRAMRKPSSGAPSP